MSSQPTLLATGCAELRRSVEATMAPAWLPDAVHDLIVAMLVRILGRLEDMIALWQAGLLPPPTPSARTTNPTPRRTPASDRTPRLRLARAPAFPSTLVPLPMPAASRRRYLVAARRRAWAIMPAGPRHPESPLHPSRRATTAARAPPMPQTQKRPRFRGRPCTPILFRYRN